MLPTNFDQFQEPHLSQDGQEALVGWLDMAHPVLMPTEAVQGLSPAEIAGVVDLAVSRLNDGDGTITEINPAPGGPMRAAVQRGGLYLQRR